MFDPPRHLDDKIIQISYVEPSITAGIREKLEKRPVVPFTIHVADERAVGVPTPDHAHVQPNRARIVVFTEDGALHILPGLLISGITVNSEQSTS